LALILNRIRSTVSLTATGIIEIWGGKFFRRKDFCNRSNNTVSGSNATTCPRVPIRLAAAKVKSPTFAPISHTILPGFTNSSTQSNRQPNSELSRFVRQYDKADPGVTNILPPPALFGRRLLITLFLLNRAISLVINSCRKKSIVFLFCLFVMNKFTGDALNLLTYLVPYPCCHVRFIFRICSVRPL